MSAPEISQVVSSARTAAEADEQYDPSKDPKRKPTRSKDPGWKYAFWPDLEKKFSLQCMLCGKKVPSGVTRFKKHLAGGFSIVEKCPKATAEIRKEMHEYLRTHGQKFESIDLDGRGEGEESDEGAQAAASSKASNTSGKRIISLCASSSGCERNWSVFAHIHTKGRNRLEYKRLNKLSYVSYNRQMTNRFEKLREEGSKGKRAQALILEEFQWDNEWVDINAELVHQAEAQGADVDGTNSLRWTHVDEAMGATEGLQGRNFPRRARGDDSESSRPTRPYITYGRRVPNLALIDPVLRAELEEEVPDSDMENSDADDDSTRRIERDEDYDLEME